MEMPNITWASWLVEDAKERAVPFFNEWDNAASAEHSPAQIRAVRSSLWKALLAGLPDWASASAGIYFMCGENDGGTMDVRYVGKAASLAKRMKDYAMDDCAWDAGLAQLDRAEFVSRVATRLAGVNPLKADEYAHKHVRLRDRIGGCTTIYMAGVDAPFEAIEACESVLIATAFLSGIPLNNGGKLNVAHLRNAQGRQLAVHLLMHLSATERFSPTFSAWKSAIAQ